MNLRSNSQSVTFIAETQAEHLRLDPDDLFQTSCGIIDNLHLYL